MRRRAVRVLAALAVTLVTLGLATPAGAHTTNAPPASNYHTVVSGLVPARTGVQATAGPDGEQIEVRVGGNARVVVLGYQEEPYLRIDRRGVFENAHSPAVALNRTRIPSGPTTRPSGRGVHWVRVASSPVARWHDHRAHWMGGVTPTVVERAPHRTHLIEQWRIPVRVDGKREAIVGRIVWQPPPNAWVSYLLALGFALAVALAIRLATRPALVATTFLLALAELVHLWGSWPSSSSSTIGRLGGSASSIAAIAMNLFAAVWLSRRSVWSSAPLLVLAGLFAVVAGGLAELPTLSHSWIPSRLDPATVRALVAFALGAGAAVAIFGARRLRAGRGVRAGSTADAPVPSGS